MLRPAICFAAIIVMLPDLLAQSAAGGPSATAGRLTYPETRRADQVDTYHGVKVEDPYRWLEDVDSPETAAWVKAQNELTFSYLEKIPFRDRMKERLTEVWNFERHVRFFEAGGRFFFFRNDGLQNQNVMFTMPALGAEPKILLDPNKMSPDGTVALGSIAVSSDGKLLAYALSRAGSDWQEVYLRDIETGKDLPDRLQWMKFSTPSWSEDNRGFYYQRFPEPKPGESMAAKNEYAKVYFHKLGDPQSADRLVYERPDQKEWIFGSGATEDGRYLIIEAYAGAEPKNAVFYKDLKAPDSKVVPLVPNVEALYSFIGNEGSRFFFHTTDAAQRGRIISIDVAKPDRAGWKEVLAERAEVIDTAALIQNTLAVSYIKDAHSQLKLHNMDGTNAREISLPGVGLVYWDPHRRSNSALFYTYTDFTVPPTIYRCDLKSGENKVLLESKLKFDPSSFETKQVFYPSKDGTQSPMFLVHKKGLKLDGQNPTYLYGYGGFAVSIKPGFNPSYLTWMEMGGLVAIANLRGGGEYGEDWHQAGTKLRKQNVFDDFIAAAEWLIKNKYTSTPKLAIGGGSNGGLLVGACLNQRPDLFGAAAPAVGVMDMLRFHKFTIGGAWVTDYGSPENPEEFKALRAYSPLHNIKPGTEYPATLITTADHDDRVVPGHSFKYAAALQHAQEGPAPILIRIETRAGHGAGKPVSKIIEETADRWAFLAHALKMEMK